MGRLWGVEGDESKFQKNDSSLAAHVVWFGVFGVIFYAWFGSAVVRSARAALISAKGMQYQVVVLIAMLLLVCAARGVFDLMTDGAWRYLMALIGLCYGMLHAISTKDALNDNSC